MIETIPESPWFQLAIALSMLGFSFGQYFKAEPVPVLTEKQPERNPPEPVQVLNESEHDQSTAAPHQDRLNSSTDQSGKSIFPPSDKPEKGTIETGWYCAKTKRYVAD
jgi:hypothetical protein